MFQYPDIEHYYLIGNIEIDDLFENDELHILYNEKEYILPLTIDIINSIKTKAYYFHDYKITFLEGIVKIEYIFPNTFQLDRCYIKRKSENTVLKFNNFQKECYSYRLILSDFELKPKDKLVYQVDFVDYELYLRQSIIDEIKSENGYLCDLKHLITYHEDLELGIKYILIQTGSNYNTTSNSHYLMYHDSLTNKQYTQYDIIKYNEDYLNIENVHFTTGSIILEYNDSQKYEIVLDDIIYQLESFYYHIIKTDIYKIQIINNDFLGMNTFDIKILNLSKNSSFNVDKCFITSDSIFDLYKQSKFEVNKVTVTSNPSYDSEDQLENYSKAELDHMKHRCICTLSGVIDDLTKIRSEDSEDDELVKQAKADNIFNYRVMPTSFTQETKRKIYNTFGPFSDFTIDEII